MIPIARAVASSCSRALVIADLAGGSYQSSSEEALKSATRFMKEARAHGVKLEGGKDFAKRVELLSNSGIPVMAHVGFTPQSKHALGGIKIQGRDINATHKLLKDALALEASGAFSCVIETVPPEVGQIVTENLKIPTVGIGAGSQCNAKILVRTDLVGFIAPKGDKAGGYLGDLRNGAAVDLASNNQGTQLQFNRAPKFVKKYANLSEILYEGAKPYASDVKSGNYPTDELWDCCK